MNPKEEFEALLAEAGKMLSSANEAQLKAAMTSIKAAMDALGKVMPEEPAAPADKRTVKEAAGVSMNDQMDRIRNAVRAKVPSSPDVDGPWCKEIYDDFLVYDYNGKLYQAPYSWGAGGQPVVGDSTEVIEQTTYVPATPAPPAVAEAALEGDFCELVEAKTELGAAKLIKIIEPGWGSSGYYSAEALKASAPAYAPGTHMYWNHPGKIEEKDRPERDLRDLAAKTTEAAYYDPEGPRGAGLYAKAKVFEHYLPAVNELAGDIGVSHRATGTRKMGEAEGRKGPVIEAVTKVHSIDFVTKPGAGGEVVQLFEAARPAQEIPALTLEGLKREHPELVESLRAEIKSAVYGAKDKLKEDKRMNEDEIKALEESNKEAAEKIAKLEEANARLLEADVLREAAGIVAGKLAESKLPDITKNRLTESLVKNPPITEGKLDTENYSQQIDEAIIVEATYIATIKESGKITGMGTSTGTEGDGKATLKESFKASFISEGKTPEVAEAMAETAVNSR